MEFLSSLRHYSIEGGSIDFHLMLAMLMDIGANNNLLLIFWTLDISNS